MTAADPGVSAADFLAKPDGSRIAGLVGRQSAVLEDPRKLALEIEAAGQRLGDGPAAVAEDHAVYTLTPDTVEFWQGDSQRQHVRLRFRRTVTAGPPNGYGPNLTTMVTRMADGSAGDADYATIGAAYTRYRRPDPRIAAQIAEALGAARTVLNVGAGAGSCRPTAR